MTLYSKKCYSCEFLIKVIIILHINLHVHVPGENMSESLSSAKGTSKKVLAGHLEVGNNHQQEDICPTMCVATNIC